MNDEKQVINSIVQSAIKVTKRLITGPPPPPFIWVYCDYDEEDFESYQGCHIEFPDKTTDLANTGNIHNDIDEVTRIVKEKGFDTWMRSSTIDNLLMDLGAGKPLCRDDDNV